MLIVVTIGSTEGGFVEDDPNDGEAFVLSLVGPLVSVAVTRTSEVCVISTFSVCVLENWFDWDERKFFRLDSRSSRDSPVRIDNTGIVVNPTEVECASSVVWINRLDFITSTEWITSTECNMSVM